MHFLLNKKNHKGQKGFTLVELLIVVIILAVLAAIVVPQFGSSTEDANVSTLKADLSTMRSAVEMYYQQHNSRYPGKYLETNGTGATAAGLSSAASGSAGFAFVAQMTQYTDKNGKVSGVKSAVFKYGPYIKGGKLPANPFSVASGEVIYADIAVVDLNTAVAVQVAAAGWKFYVGTGRFIANDGATLSDGSTNTVDF